MPFWVFLLIYAATFLITELLRPKPKIEDAKPAGLGDFQVPTATEGRVVPLIWGRVKVSGPNVVWYGDLVADPQRDTVKTGLFSKKKVTTGFNYYLGLQFGLCRGPVTLMRHIRNDESFVWGPDASTADTPVIPVDAGGTFTINQPNFYGGADSGGGGGLVGSGRIYPGSETQAVNAYLTPFQSPQPAYRGTCYMVLERINVGFAPTLRVFEFELERFPDGLDLASVQPGDERIGDTCNPMNVVYEALNDSEWGLNISPSGIDVIALRAVAATLATEANGFAWIWDRPQDVLQVIQTIEQQVDGVLFQDPVSGAYSFKLIRFDYTPGTLPLLDESNVRRLIRFARPAWAETQNQLQVEFNDPRKNYTQSFALSQDMANIDIVNAINSSKMRFPGVKDATLANEIAWREIRQLSFPVATGQLEVDRSQYAVTPGDVLELTWSRLGITLLPIRITKVNRGRILDNIIKLDWAQDVFAFNPGSFADPPDTGWVEPDTDAQANLSEILIEVPYRITDDGIGDNTTESQVGTLVVRGGDQEVGYNTYATVDDPPITPPNPTVDSIITPGGAQAFTPSGLLTAAYDSGQTNGFVDATGFIIDNATDATLLQDATTTQLENRQNVLIVDNEIMLFRDVTDNLDGTFTIFNVIRGALDTLPAAHADNARVYFLSYGIGVVNGVPEADGTLNWKARNQAYTPFDVFDFASTLVLAIATDTRAAKGYPPRNVRINLSAPGGGYFPVSAGSPSGAELVGVFDVTWKGSDKFNQAFATEWDDGSSIVVEAGVTFRLRIIEDPGGADTVVVDLTGLTVSGSGTGSQIESGFADDTITDLYQVELSSQSAAGDSQVWIIGPVNIYGYGYKYGERYGGDNDGTP
jgi:hypothetical protein